MSNLSEKFSFKMVTETAFDEELDILPQTELWYLNGTFQVIESTLSHAGILHIGGVGGVSLAVILGIIASSALAIRGIFTYYLMNYAPKGRALNRLMLVDQVSQSFDLIKNKSFGYLALKISTLVNSCREFNWLWVLCSIH